MKKVNKGMFKIPGEIVVKRHEEFVEMMNYFCIAIIFAQHTLVDDKISYCGLSVNFEENQKGCEINEYSFTTHKQVGRAKYFTMEKI